MTTLRRRIRHAQFALSGYVGRSVSLSSSHKLTVLITYFHPTRMRMIDDQLRNVLKCSFVERLIVSNHNPEMRIEEKVNIDDSRLTFLNQTVKRGCGYRWSVAIGLQPEYLLVIDDDVFLFPKQIGKLFKHLIDEPQIPHGIAGMLRGYGAGLAYYERKNMVVDFLCETYAVTQNHLKRYAELRQLIAANDMLATMIESAADFMVISQTGTSNPKIHDVGRLFRDSSFQQAGVAVHKRDEFDASLVEVSRALNESVVRTAAAHS